jgi:hypothetical protein
LFSRWDGHEVEAVLSLDDRELHLTDAEFRSAALTIQQLRFMFCGDAAQENGYVQFTASVDIIIPSVSVALSLKPIFVRESWPSHFRT